MGSCDMIILISRYDLLTFSGQSENGPDAAKRLKIYFTRFILQRLLSQYSYHGNRSVVRREDSLTLRFVSNNYRYYVQRTLTTVF